MEPRIEQLEDLAFSSPMSDADRKENSEAIRAFYILQPDYIDASRDGAVEKYGSLDKYLERRLGLNSQKIDNLRNLLTAPLN